MVAVISVDAYPYPLMLYIRLDLSPEGYKNKCFLVAMSCLTVRRPNLQSATKRFLHQQVKISGWI